PATMATNPNLNINLPPPSTSSQSSAPFTPRPTSFVDDSDAEFDPTPLHSPRGGPDYDDLPPSYDEAQHQAVSDARHGITPLDPNQIEAHRLTLNEGPNQPEIWEYRVRGEQVEEEREQAPEYGNITRGSETTVPVQHVQNTEHIPVGRVGPVSPPAPDPAAALLDRALSFTRHEPDADVQYAPRLTRPIALPQDIPDHGQRLLERSPVQFSRAYAKALHAHSIRPAEFVEFLDGLNALCVAANTTVTDLLSESPMTDATPTLVHDYVRSANEGFFAPRGLRVSIQSLSTLMGCLAVPEEKGQQAGAVASVTDTASTPNRRAQALHPWIEALEFDVPQPSAQTSLLQFMTARHKEQKEKEGKTGVNVGSEDPPDSVPDVAAQRYAPPHAGPHDHFRQGQGRCGHRGGPWTPFGAPGHGPFGPHGNGPSGHPGCGPFGGAGRGPSGGRGRGPFGPPGFGAHGPSYQRGHDRGGHYSSGPGQNEWSAWGRNLGRWGEEFGKRMGDWGQEFGKQAEVWGRDVGKRAETFGEHVSGRASGNGTRSRPSAGPAQAGDAHPPGYEEGPHAQETGVLRGDIKENAYGRAADALGETAAKSKDDDDASSISSDSSDSDSDSDSESDDLDDEDDLPDAQGIFLKRVHSINKQAEAAAQKGKKSREEIAAERALAIEKAQDERTALQLKIEEKISKRSLKRVLRQKRRDLKREHRHKKRELRTSHTGKGKAKAKKSPEWKAAKKEYKDKKKELRKEKLKLRKEIREARAERMKAQRSVGVVGNTHVMPATFHTGVSLSVNYLVIAVRRTMTTMNPHQESVQVDEFDIGLDRSNVTKQGQIQLPPQEVQPVEDDPPFEPVGRSSSNMVNALKERKHHAAVKIRQKLHISKDSDDLSSHAPVLANAADTKSDSRLMEKIPAPDKHTLKDFAHNPVDTVKSKVSNQGNQQIAANIAAKEISHGQEVDLVNAHDKIGCATTESERLLAIQDVSHLLKERQSTYARWSLDRHVMKVRQLPRETMVQKTPADFQRKNIRGELFMDYKAYWQHQLVYFAHMYGGQYIGFGSDPPTPSKETIMPNIERLIVATSPFQELIMTTRRVYRWESPPETIKYLLIYVVLWYFNLIIPGVMSAVLYLVVERRVHGNTLEDLRSDIKHREDQQQAALSLNEFIEKRGDDKWADEIVEVVGPWLMVQLADMANFFESVRNFYEWRKPTRTAATLGAFACVILVIPFIPLWLLVKSIGLSFGFTFFALFPLATNFPEYRLLVSPTKRLFWNIPTHAEWAIKYIQAEGTRFAANTNTQTSNIPLPSAIPIKTTPKAAQAQDYGFYKSHFNKDTGHLIISATSCRFVSNVGHIVHFVLAYEQINRVEKQDRQVKKNVPSKLTTDSGKDLKLVTKEGKEWVMENLEQRDEAFSQIVGFSQTTWQIVW
ncbi:hypothetical protein EK21DRAFT_59218, partial [Setomelanomma holmii]